MNQATFGRDFLASLVVFLVALPLCMGIAIASGVPPALGLITGIVGGLVVGLIAGSPLQVSGPAAGLTVIVWEIVHQHGLAMLGTVVLAAGLIQVVAGLLKSGGWFRAISPAVIQGMLSGIGVLIIASQIHLMVDSKPVGNGIQNLTAIPQALLKGIFPQDGSTHHVAAFVGLFTIGIIMAWSMSPRKWQVVPAPLVGVIGASLLAFAMQLPIQYVGVPANLADVLTFPTWETLAKLADDAVLLSVVTLAVVASAETMLTATAVDTMHNGPRTHYDRELMAQGVGNTVCGLLGALPMTGVIVRSSANVQAGAKTRISTILHGVWILLFVAFLPGVIRLVPITALAALLVYTGFKLLNPKIVKELAQYGRSEVLIYMATIVAIVATNLLEGILIGLGLALSKLLVTLSHLRVRQTRDGHRLVVHLEGAATFIGLPKLAQVLGAIPKGGLVDIHLGGLIYVDHASLNHLREWEKQYVASQGQVTIAWEELYDKYQSGRPSSLKERTTALTGV